MAVIQSKNSIMRSPFHDRFREGSQLAHDDGCAGALVECFKPQGTLVRTRCQQPLALRHENKEVLYLVISGLLTVHAALPVDRRVILSILFPGDVLGTALIPPMPGVVGLAANDGECLRVRAKPVHDALRTHGDCGRILCDQLSRQQSRLMLRLESLGILSSEERVAAFFVEMGLRLGAPVGGGTAFDLPLTRSDIAAYLALNPDTLSRQMSRLKERGIVDQLNRSQFVIRDWDTLRRECQIAGALEGLHAPSAAMRPKTI